MVENFGKAWKEPTKTILVWYLSAIEIIDTQVARQGRQYHRNPPYKKKTKKNRLIKEKKTKKNKNKEKKKKK